MSSDATIPTIHSKSKHLTHKQYRSELKAALDGFQKTREWADLIQNLSKLHRVFMKFKHIHDEFNEAVQSSPSTDAYRHRVLPHTVQVCKVLAMCLTPGRPAGVHLKAIEVYQAVFQNLSRQNLIADLGLWLCGLLPLASFASTRVRPILLKLLKEYVISLGEPCRVALDGLITSLLPCIEEQHTPLYFQAVQLLHQLAQNTGLPFFFSAIMRTICCCSHVRISATHYLNLLFKDKALRHQCLELCKSNEALCIEAWLCVLRDSENILAKRNILDLLNAHFPLNELLLSKLEPRQILLLVHGLLPVMLFREVSVNRRIYSWLLNVNTNDMEPITTTTSSPNKIDVSLSASSMDSEEQINNISDDALTENTGNNEGLSEMTVPLLSEYSENIIVDAFRLYLDRSGDINLVGLSTADSGIQSEHSFMDQTNHSLPVPGLAIFKKLTYFDNDDNVNAEQYITSPLNLLKILIDRNEIRSSKVIQRLHSKLLQYAYSFEPNSMADPTNLAAITCFQAVIQSTQLIYAQIDTHHTIQWLRGMVQSKYDQFVQSTPDCNENENDMADDGGDGDGDGEEIIINDEDLTEISPTKRKFKPLLTIDIPNNVRHHSSFIESHWINRSDACNVTLLKAIELIDFALDFIPIVSRRDEIADSIAQLEQADIRIDSQQKYSDIDKDVACLVGDVLSKLHTLLIGDTRIQGIRFCLKLFQRLGKKAANIPSEHIIAYLSHSVAVIPSLENVKDTDSKTSQYGKVLSPQSPRTEMLNRLELEVIELNFQLLQIVINAQNISMDDFKNDKEEKPEMCQQLASVIRQHLEFAEQCVYVCKCEQLVLCAAQIWLKLINSYSFLPKEQSSCKNITSRLWQLIEPSKSSAINYQIAKLLMSMADIHYCCVQRVISASIVNLRHTDNKYNVNILAETYQRFCTLYRIMGEIDGEHGLRYYWNEIVYIMLAACSDDRPLIHNIATQWLTESLSLPPRVLDPMLLELLESSTTTIPIGPEIYQYNQWYDPRLASDTLKKLLSIVISMGNKLISSCSHCALTTNIIDKLLLHGCTLSTNHLQNHLQSVVDTDKTEKDIKLQLSVNRTSSLYLPSFECRDYLDVLVLIGLKYIRGNVHPKTSGDVQNSGLRVRTIAIEFLRRLFQQFGHNLRCAKLAASITATIIHQLSIAIQEKQYLFQIELLSLLQELIIVSYRRVDPNPNPNDNKHKKQLSDSDKQDSTAGTHEADILFIGEPDIFCSQFFTNTILNGIQQSCKLKLGDMQIQLFPLKHFLRFCTFSCDYIKKGLSHFIMTLFNVLCKEVSNNNNIQHMKHLLDGMAVLLKKLIRNPQSNMQINEDTDFNAGTWMVHILTFGLATAAMKKNNNKNLSEEEQKEKNMERPAFLIETEMKLFRSWPMIMECLCVAWGRTTASFVCDNNQNNNMSALHSANSFSSNNGRRNSLSHSTSRRLRKEVDELHIGQIQQQIIALLTPFFQRHNTLVFVAVLNNWEKELNIGKVWALEMRSGVKPSHEKEAENEHNLILNYGGHSVLSRECEQHENVLNLLNRLIEVVPPQVVLPSICDIAVANINKSEIRNTSMLVRMNECTPLHFMYYYIHSLPNQAQQIDSIVTVWYSIRKYFDQILNCNSSHPMAYLWILSILQRIIQRFGVKLMSDKQRKKSFISITKLICQKIADVAGHSDKYQQNQSKVSDPSCLPPILFFVPSRQHHSNDFPPLPDWIQQLLLSHNQHTANRNNHNMTPLVLSGPALTHKYSMNMTDESASISQENLSQKVYNSLIPRVYASPTLGVSLASIRVLANMLSLFLHQVFRKESTIVEDKDNKNVFDTDSINNILYSVINHLSHILSNLSKDNILFLNGYGSILSSLSIQQYRSHCHKTYIREAWNYFIGDKFFIYCDVSTLHHWQWIIGSVIECDKSKLKYELLNNPSNTINVLFNKHIVDVDNRTKQLKRLAFVIHAGRRDQYGRYLNTILEKLVESLKIQNAEKLYCQVFVCLRVLLTRIDVTNLSPIWPLIITETIRAFESSSDKALLLSVCKFVDTALILLPQTFQLFKWCFVHDSITQKLLRKTSASPDSVSVHCNDDIDNNNKCVFIPHLQLLAKRLEQERKEKAKKEGKEEKEKECKSGMFGNGLNSHKTMKRPILLMRRISDVSELIPFHRIVSSLHQTQSQIIDVDYKFLDDLIRSDFIQSNFFANPMLRDIREPSPFQ